MIYIPNDWITYVIFVDNIEISGKSTTLNIQAITSNEQCKLFFNISNKIDVLAYIFMPLGNDMKWYVNSLNID